MSNLLSQIVSGGGLTTKPPCDLRHVTRIPHYCYAQLGSHPSRSGFQHERCASNRIGTTPPAESERGRLYHRSLLNHNLLSAFLLFQVELIAGKYILPRFGGSSSVWNTCLLAFQVLLLASYGYAHFLSSRFSSGAQARIHIFLLAISAVTLAVLARFWSSPITPTASWRPSHTDPVWQVIRFLAMTIGVPFFLLSATAPLLQTWFSRTQNTSPYRLYALSNLGSLLGLVTYPIAVERFLPLTFQSWIWSAGYATFCAACGGVAWFFGRSQVAASPAPEPGPSQGSPVRPRWTSLALWVALPGCASAMLLATTNLLTRDIAAVPLLWVPPLCIYLITFIVCFQSDRCYKPSVYHILYAVAFVVVLEEISPSLSMRVLLHIGALCLALFAVCIVCHGELARLKPPATHLSTFYFMLSAGGALGSVCVVLIAPRIFQDIAEFTVTLVLCGGLLLAAVMLDQSSWFHTKRAYRGMALVALVVLMLQGYRYEMAMLTTQGTAKVIMRERNFFGVKTVKVGSGAMWLLHNNTLHGAQFTDTPVRDEPTLYYERPSGVGLVLAYHPRLIDSFGQPESLRVGAVGLGAGTVATYGRPGDYFRFYEIDPQVIDLSMNSSPLFTFIHDSRAHVDVIEGDARLSLEQEADKGQLQKFDVLILDAFSGDSVPVHLLTKEAMELYLRHLRGPNSVICFHLTNRSLDLRPVTAGLAREYNLASAEVEVDLSDWVLMSANPEMLRSPAILQHSRPIQVHRSVPLWTDEYSNVLGLLGKY